MSIKSFFLPIFLYIFLAIIGFLLLGTIILCLSSLFIQAKKDYEKESPYYRWILNATTGIMCVLLRIHLHVSGKEHVPSEGSFLLVCNHRSKFDPIMTWFIFGMRKTIFVTKPENLKIPVFGRIVHRLRFIKIDRKSIAASAPAFRRGTELLKEENTCIAVYPEGTRSLDCKLLPFHAVVFSMAKHAKVPVLVMTVRGTEKIRRNYPWHRSDVYFDFIECIPQEWIAQNKTRELCSRAEKDIKASLDAQLQ